MNRILKALPSLNQLLFAAIAIIGVSLLLFATIEDWFVIPTAPGFSDESACFGSQDSTSVAPLVKASPSITRLFQSAVGVGVLLVLFSFLPKRKWTVIQSLLACAILLVALAYPYFVMVRCPEFAAEATWLQMQHDNVTWLGGDIYANAEFSSQGWHAKTYFIDVPRQINVSHLPCWAPNEFGLSRTGQLVAWLGYSNVFCQFANRGWFCALLGACLVLAASFQNEAASNSRTQATGYHVGFICFRRASIALSTLLILSVLLAATAWSVPLRTSSIIDTAKRAWDAENYDVARESLDQAEQLLPTLRHDTAYVYQRAFLDQKQGVISDYTRLARSRSLESVGRYDQAFAILDDLASSSNSSVRREAMRGILRFAIQDFNSTRFKLASERFLRVLRRTPGDLKLIYIMQIQAIRDSRVDDVYCLCQQMYTATDCFNFGTRKILRAAAQQHNACAAGLTSDAWKVWLAQSKARQP